MRIPARLGIAATAAVAGMLLYAPGAMAPPLYFDEVHYAGAAAMLAAGQMWEEVHLDPATLASDHPRANPLLVAWAQESLAGEPRTFVTAPNGEHPMLGKWAMAAAVAATGAPTGARWVSVVAGAAGLAGAAALAWRLGGRRAAVLAPALLAADPLWFVQSRIAMLDAAAAAAALWSLALAAAPAPRRGAVALLAGAALSCKLSAGLALPLVAGLLWHRTGSGRQAWAWGVAAPLGVLAASYAPHIVAAAGQGAPAALAVLPMHAAIMMVWSAAGTVGHPGAAPVWSWWIMDRAMPYGHWWQDGQAAAVHAVGNPVVWWVAAGATCVALWHVAQAGGRAHGGKAWRGAGGPGPWRAVLAAGGAALWMSVPLGLLARDGFVYYMTAASPLLAVAAALALAHAWRRHPHIGPQAAGTVVGLAWIVFVLWHPMLSGQLVDPGLSGGTPHVPWAWVG